MGLFNIASGASSFAKGRDAQLFSRISGFIADAGSTFPTGDTGPPSSGGNSFLGFNPEGEEGGGSTGGGKSGSALDWLFGTLGNLASTVAEAAEGRPSRRPRVIYGQNPISNPVLRQRLEIFARQVGRDVIITGGDRLDPGANRVTGGVPNSRHLRAMAADLAVQGLTIGQAAIAADEATLPGNRILFSTVIFEFNHVHIDLELRGGVPYRGVRRPQPGASTTQVPNFRDD